MPPSGPLAAAMLSDFPPSLPSASDRRYAASLRLSVAPMMGWTA